MVGIKEFHIITQCNRMVEANISVAFIYFYLYDSSIVTMYLYFLTKSYGELDYAFPCNLFTATMIH